MKTILAPVDFSETTAETLATALNLAQSSGATVMLLHVVTPSSEYRAYPGYEYDALEKETVRAQRSLGQLLASVRIKGIHASGKVIGGDPADQIVSHAREIQADVIVLGFRGHTALYDVVTGSTSSRVLKSAPCPVLFSCGRKSNRATAELVKAG